MDFFVPRAKKYHGLYNQGATCYLNSVLQVLFMTEDFREAVDRHASENPTECIDRHLKTLFDDLKGHTAHTGNITKQLGIYRVYEQNDAAQYFEKILSMTSREASQIFRGLLTHKTICTECRIDTDTDAAFWHLPLALVDSDSEDYRVVDGIDEYFRSSDFSGQNRMYCDNCNDKSDSTIQCMINHHPEVVTLLLKRFELDYSNMTYVKNNCTVDIPCSLSIPQNQTYELYAVVEHYGDLRGGHYIAKIKSQDDGRWYNFNDATVKLLKNQPFQGHNNVKSSSAYLLFYRKKNDPWTQDYREVSTPGGFQPAAGHVYDQCRGPAKMREGEEVAGAVEAANDSRVSDSIDRNEKTGVELPPDYSYNVDDQGYGAYARQSRPNNHQECSEEMNDAHSEKQRDKGKIMTDDKEYMRGNAEADDQAEHRGSQLEESVDNQDNDGGRPDDVRWWRSQEGHINTSYNEQEYELEVSNMQARYNPQQVSVDMQKDKERMAMDRKMEGDEQSERRGKASTKYLDLDAGNRDIEGLDYVRQNIHEAQGRTQEVGQVHGLKPVGREKQGGEEKIQIDGQVDKEGKTGDDEWGMASGSGNLLTIYDLCCYKIENNGDRKDKDDVRQRRPQGDCEQNIWVTHTTHKDVEAKEPGKKGDGHVQNREASFTVTGEERQENSPPKARTGFREDTMEGRHGSEQSRTYHEKRSEHECKETPSGIQRRETENIRIETVEGTSQDGIKTWAENDEGKDPKTKAKVSLSDSVCKLKLSDSSLPEPQTGRSKRVSDAQVQARMKRAMKKNTYLKKRRFWHHTFLMKNQMKKKKTTRCFSFGKRQKNAEQTTESD